MADSNVTAMTVVMIATAALSFVFMSLRFFSKRLVAGARLGLDDAVLAFAWLLYLVFVVISIYATKFGLGKHLSDIDLLNDLPKLLYALPIGQFFAVISVAVSKSSFILTLLRLVTRPWQKWALWFMLATINASLLSISIVQFFQCAEPPTPGCIPSDAVIGLGVFAAGYSAALDLVLTVFPALIIWNVQMKKREKLGIIISMSLGVVAGVVGIYKSSTIPFVSRSADFTYGTAIVLIWLAAEVSATIIAASIPFYRPLIRRFSGTKSLGESYGMSHRSRTRSGHNKLGSTADVKRGSDFDTNSDKAILGASSKIVCKTNITVSYSHDDEERQERQNYKF